MRVFFDTNVLLSALLWPGLVRELVERVLTSHAPITGEPVLAELNEKLRAKFRATPAQVAEALVLVRRCQVEPTPPILPAISIRDSKDLPILACALAAKADVLVTGDGDLLELAGRVPLEILSPRALWDRLTATQP